MHNTSIGHGTIAGLVEPLSGGRVALEGLSGRMPHSLRVQRVELHDADGAWLVIENAALEWSPLSLLHHRVDVTSFAAGRVHLIRLPSEEGDGGSNPAIDVRDLRIARLDTDAAVSRTPVSLEVRGSLRYASLEEWNADLAANRFDASGLYRVRASSDRGLLAGAADIEEPPAGLLAGLLGLNDIGAIEVHATGSGPREANAVRVTLTAGSMRASGNGVINMIARTGEIDFTAEAPEMALRPDLAWQSLSAEGQLQGAFDAPTVDANLRVRNLRAQGVAAEGVTASISGQAGAIDVSASLTGFRLPGSEPDVFARAPISARGTLNLQSPARAFSVSLSHPLMSVEAHGTAGDARRVQARVLVPRLAPSRNAVASISKATPI